MLGVGGGGPTNETPLKASNAQGEITQRISQVDYPFTCPLRFSKAKGKGGSGVCGMLSAPARRGYMSQLNKYGCMLSSST